MSEFVVSPACYDLGLRAGAIVLRAVRIENASSELRSAVIGELEKIRREFASLSMIRELPELTNVREIIRAVGVKPKNHPPSTQKLMEYGWKRGTLPSINNLVDAYNLVSLRSRCSLGAHDLDKIARPVELRIFRGSESFRPLGSDEDKQINQGEFGYVDGDERVVCRLDSLQAEFSKVTSSTTAVLLIIESTTVHDAQQLRQIFSETIETIDQYCEAEPEIVAFPG